MNLADLFIAKKLAGGGGGGTGTDNYNDLSNKPQINSTALTGDKSSSDLGLQSEIDSDNKISADYVDDTNASNKFVSAAEKLEWSGKQDAIDADHKIDADYVDDTTSDNKFVTASDKTAWNAKQNAIDSSHKLSSDLVDDTGHTNLFVTSTEKSTWNGKQDKIDSSHKLSSTLVSFDSSEAAALASGIDSSKVGQISTNQTNILYVANRTGKNRLPFFGLDVIKSINTDGSWSSNAYTRNGVTFTVNDDNTISVSGTLDSGKTSSIFWLFSVNQKVPFKDLGAGNVLSGCPSGGGNQTYGLMLEMNELPYSGVAYDFSNHPTITPAAATKDDSIIGCYIVVSTHSAVNVVFEPMVSEPDMYALDPSYVPYALPNYDLTRLEAEDRASLAEVVDSGAKNKLWYDLASLKTNNSDANWTWDGNVATHTSGVSVTVNSDMSLSISGNPTGTQFIFTLASYNMTTRYAGMYLSGCPTGGNFQSGYALYVTTAPDATLAYDTGDGVDLNDTGINAVRIIGRANATTNGKVFKPMICTLTDVKVSQRYVPYRPDWDFLTPKTKSNLVYFTVADTWEYTGLSFTAQNEEAYIFFMSMQWDSGAPKGLLLSTASTAAGITDSNTYAVVEDNTGSNRLYTSYQIVKRSGAATYYLYAKNANASGYSNVRLTAIRIQ